MKAKTFLWIGLGTVAVGTAAFFLLPGVRSGITDFVSNVIHPEGGSTYSTPRAMTQEEIDAVNANLPKIWAAKGGVTAQTLNEDSRQELMERVGFLGFNLI